MIAFIALLTTPFGATSALERGKRVVAGAEVNRNKPRIGCDSKPVHARDSVGEAYDDPAIPAGRSMLFEAASDFMIRVEGKANAADLSLRFSEVTTASGFCDAHAPFAIEITWPCGRKQVTCPFLPGRIDSVKETAPGS